MVNQKGHLTFHTKLFEKLLSGVGRADREQGQQTSALNIDTGFKTEISALSEYRLQGDRIEHGEYSVLHRRQFPRLCGRWRLGRGVIGK